MNSTLSRFIRQFVPALFCLLSPAVARSPSFVTNGLVAFYELNGNGNDSSGRLANGVATALTYQTNRFGTPNSAGRFNGMTSSVKVPAIFNFNLLPLTATAWVAFDENRGTDLGIVSLYPTASANGWGIFANGMRTRSWYYGNGGGVAAEWLVGPELTSTRWYQVATTFDGTAGRLYVDGTLVASREWTGNVAPSSSPQGLFIGEMLPAIGGPLNFNGAIDDVRVYDRALSDSEIRTLYQLESASVRRAAATARVDGGFVVEVLLTDGGYGYSAPPTVEILGNGSGATAVASVANGRVTGFQVTNAGIGYTGPVTVRIAPPPKAPSLTIAVQTVRLTFNVWQGQRYLVESSTDLSTWKEQLDFVAEADEVTRDFVATETGQYFRINEIQ